MYHWKFKTATVTLLALCLLWLSSDQVSAQTITYTDTIPLQPTNWDEQLSLPRFDPALGILTEIEFLLTGEVDGTAKVENLDAAPANVTAESFATVRLQRPDGTFITMATPVASRLAQLSAFDGTIDFTGGSGTIIRGINGLDISERTILSDTNDLFAFTGDSPITLQVNTTGASTASGAGNLGLSFSTLASAAITVTYHFEQPAIVLEKATNGFDADLIPGPLLNPGTIVTWSYTVTNIGNVPLVDLILIDDQEGDVTAGCPQRELAIGETILCLANGIAQLGQYTNTAIVTGTVPPELPGEPRRVRSTEPSHYFGTTGSFCPMTATGDAILPDLLYLGEGVGTYSLPAGYQQFVVKKFTPLHFDTITASSYQSTRRSGAPERVWACSGNCNFTPGLKELIALGELPADTHLHVVAIDDDDDDRVNLLIANQAIDQPVARVEPQALTEYLPFVLPFAADWGFYVADSIGLQICIEP